nr:PREDICTED: sine oculis-binding protein homolog isoform X1 [Bemisia tabaci]
MMAFPGNNVHCRGIKLSINAKEREPKDLSVKNGGKPLSWCNLQKRDRGERQKRVMIVDRKRRKPSSPFSEDSCASDDIEACSIGSPPSHIDTTSPRVSPLPPAVIPNGYVACGWCQKVVKSKAISFKAVNGDKSFCSEVCFTQCRRASFKRKKTCDWCKHVRHTVNYVDFQDGDHQLQFCSGKCLNQYKMNIFCRETQAHLDLHPHLQGSETTKTKTANSTNLITPDLWLRDCESDSSPSASPSPPPHPPSPPTPPCVPSPLIEIKVSTPSSPPSSATPTTSDHGINLRVRKEILNRKRKKAEAESPVNPPPPLPNNFFNFNPHPERPPFNPEALHRPPFNPEAMPRPPFNPSFPHMFPPFHRPMRLPPPLLPINRPLVPPPPPPSQLLPPPTVLIPYPVALPIPVPVPIPVPIPIPLEVFATLRQKEDKSSQPPAEKVQVKTEPVSPPPTAWQEAEEEPEKRPTSRASLEKQKTVPAPCI